MNFPIEAEVRERGRQVPILLEVFPLDAVGPLLPRGEEVDLVEEGREALLIGGPAIGERDLQRRETGKGNWKGQKGKLEGSCRGSRDQPPPS